MSLNRSGWLTLRQAAAWIGEGNDRNAARRLLRKLRAAERRTRRRLTRQDTTGNGSVIWVTKATLRDAFPEQFGRAERVESQVKERFERLEREQHLARKERRAIGARILRHERDVHGIK